MNFSRPARFVSVTTAAVSLFMACPALWGAASGDGGAVPLYSAMAVGMLFSGLLYLASRENSVGDMDAREAILSAVGSWVFASAVTGLPYFFSWAAGSFLDAMFEGVSGFTTTGASIIEDLAAVPPSILLWRSVSQWVGGIGIVVVTLAVFPMSDAGMRLYKTEVTGPFHERLTPRIHGTAVILVKTYLILTCAQVVMLLFGGLGIFDALTLSFSTAGTGGFSPYRDNVGHFAGTYVKWVTAVFLFLSASNLTFLYSLAVRKSLRPTGENPEMKFYAFMLIVFGTLISSLLYLDGTCGSARESLTDGFFHTVSMLSTCGFFTADYNEWPASVRTLMLMLMFCGGCSISTAGGMTCARVLVVFRHIGAEFRRRLHPRAIVPTRVGESPANEGVVSACFAYVTAYIAIFTAAIAIVGFFGLDITRAFSGVAATLGNVGPGFGMAAPGAGYASLPSAVKIVYMFLMLCGRLEIFTLLAVFTPDFWRK
ncbi:MAG: TrkH family potassium uptake protein [Synergistaceae bacterium]|nr:TrkH family potassium uptake protein [Synergistaceae bacterium]